MSDRSEPWYVYLLRCSDDSIYTGISNNVENRVRIHNEGKGAAYTSSRRPVNLIYQEKHQNKVSAMRREILIKKWGRKRKELLAKDL